MIDAVEKKLNITKPKGTKTITSSSLRNTIEDTIEDSVDVTENEIIETIKDGEKRNFYIEKTSTQDVYHLYDIKTSAFVDNACVPSMKVSKFLQASFGNSAMVVKLPIVAEFSTRFGKWIPKALIPQ
jgi:hypothetical protein